MRMAPMRMIDVFRRVRSHQSSPFTRRLVERVKDAVSTRSKRRRVDL